MSGGEAVLEAMRAAGVFGHVAADGADRLRGRIGRIEIAVAGDALGDAGIDDAGLDHHARIGDIDFENAIHARQADDNAVRDRQRSAAEARAGAARHERNPFAMADAHHGLHLLGGSRQHHGGGMTRKLVSPSHS